MKRKASAALSLLLALVLLTGMFPVTAFAADEEYVLTTINHLSAVSIVDVADTHSATFTVPYSFSGSVDFSTGLDITYDTETYASASASFPSGSVAEVDGEAVAMTVTYQKIDDTALYTAAYTLNVVRADAVAPDFGGTLAMTVTAPGELVFTGDDFTGLYTQNDGGALSAVAITGSTPAFGSLKLSGEDYTFATMVSLAQLSSGALTFDATAEGTVSYTAQAYAEGSVEPLSGEAILTITVTAAVTADFGGTLEKTVTAPGELVFTGDDFTGLYTQNDGSALSAVAITGSTPAFGTLKLSGEDYTFGTQVTLAQLSSGALIFDATAEGTVSYTVQAYVEDSDEPLSGTAVLTVTAAADAEDEDAEEEETPQFTDVGRNHIWAREAIEYMYQNGIVNGDGKGHYNPNAAISRGDFTLMLCRAFSLQADYGGNFSDVDEDSYYAGAIATAKALKIAKGNGGKFNPKSSLSRQDAMVLAVRAMEAAGYTLQTGDETGLQAYSDCGKVSDYAAQAIAALVDAGIIQGSGGKLSPKANVSRAEMAVILYRILNMES